MKYIIELPEEPLSILALSTIKGIPKATKIETFEPYIEPDRKAIENEVWELLKTIGNTPAGQRVEIFETINYWDIVDNLTYPEVKAKYEAWKTEFEEIHVGDEVEYDSCDETVRFVVTGTDGKRAYGIKSPCDYYDCGEYNNLDLLRKTGRHFTEIEELLKKMGDEK